MRGGVLGDNIMPQQEHNEQENQAQMAPKRRSGKHENMKKKRTVNIIDTFVTFI